MLWYKVEAAYNNMRLRPKTIRLKRYIESPLFNARNSKKINPITLKINPNP